MLIKLIYPALEGLVGKYFKIFLKFYFLYHLSYLLTQFNLNTTVEFIYPCIFYYDLLLTKVLTLLSYSNMLSDLAEGFAVMLILLILIVSNSVISIKVQEQVKYNNSRNSISNIYNFAFKYLSNK